MILLLLNYSISYAQSDTTSFFSTGEVLETKDSVLLPIELVKVANTKMIELKYEKEINKQLKDIVRNDSIINNALSDSINNTQIRCGEEVKRIKKQRNIIGGSLGAATTVSIILLIIALL